MKPLSCMHPEWVPPYGPELWRRTPFPETDEARQHPERLRPIMWVNDQARAFVSVAPDRLVLSCHHSRAERHRVFSYEGPNAFMTMEEIFRASVQVVFIGDERPEWVWRQGGDVAKRGWEHAGRLGPQPEPVHAWHLTDPAQELT